MSKQSKVRLIKYGCCALFVGLMAYTYIALRDFAGATMLVKYQMLCDAFTIPGLLLVMVGALIWIGNMGALDGVAYAVSFAIRSLIPGARYKDERYGDYVARKRENKVRGYGFLLISGCITMLIAIVFYILFYVEYL